MIALWMALKRALRELVGHGGKYSLEYGSIQLLRIVVLVIFMLPVVF